MRLIKLPIGQKNVLIQKIKPAKAQNCKMLKGWDKQKAPQTEAAFNTPVLCIVLRKAA